MTLLNTALDIITLSMMQLSITTYHTATLSIMIQSIMTFVQIPVRILPMIMAAHSIRVMARNFTTLSIMTLIIVAFDLMSVYAECHYA
jgi:hypothetical protein